MLLHKIYYWLKPGIPRGAQIKLRSWVISRKRSKFIHIWPIDKEAGRPPEGWTSWPKKKRFALILTHDVESSNGLKKCIPLARIEESLGFRSSFNFVAEGYVVPSTLRNNLIDCGFEVGVHGVNHNGNPFRSRKIFQEQAIKINQYLRDWGSVGFRSPCMYHNLKWIGELNIEYDSSTFDTDPFEPQPDGVGTIFPFLVPRRNSSLCTPPSPSCVISSSPDTSLLTPNDFFVELPYTLPQDHTVFILLRERDITIWKKKVDWIVECGGMALLNVHPDYMSFGDEKPKTGEYPAKFYEEFLSYIKDRYHDQYWHVLPKEIARFWIEYFQITNAVK